MSTINQLFVQHLHAISIAVIASLLVIYGSDINRFIKRLVGGSHFVIRLGIFMLVCAVGYGLATILLAELLRNALVMIPRQYLVLSIIGIFGLLGLLADSRRQV